MEKEIDSFSVSDIVWTQFKKNRVSFSFKGLAESIHFTIAWNNESGKMNLHITKNIGDGTADKPKFVIANFNKAFLDELMSFAPALIFNKIFQPLSFKRYSRKERKNIQILFFDNLEEIQKDSHLKEELTSIWDRNSEIKRKRLKISVEIEKEFAPIICSQQMKSLLLKKFRNLTSRSFNSNSNRVGIIIMGRKTVPFITINGKCYGIIKRMTIYELLTSFAEPEFTRSLLDYIREALKRLPDANSWADTMPYNRPYQLYINKAG